jgi:hypothetical protein
VLKFSTASPGWLQGHLTGGGLHPHRPVAVTRSGLGVRDRCRRLVTVAAEELGHLSPQRGLHEQLRPETPFEDLVGLEAEPTPVPHLPRSLDVIRVDDPAGHPFCFTTLVPDSDPAVGADIDDQC